VPQAVDLGRSSTRELLRLHADILTELGAPTLSRPEDPGAASATRLDRSPYGRELAARRLRRVRAVQITRFGGLEVMDVVDLPDPVPADGEQLFDISSAGVNFADTHHRES
jgi:hypothetical protein